MKLETRFAPVIENQDALGRFVFLCEHASCNIPPAWGDLGLPADARRAHIAWDPGALGVARGLAKQLGGALAYAPVSRLVYDCNRAPDMAGAMPEKSEVYDIPGNAAITPQERVARTQAVYLPWVEGVHSLIAQRIAAGLRPVIVTIHSFTPVYFGTPRALEFGVIHDAAPALSTAILAAATQVTGLNSALNEPYSAADNVTHSLRLHATPYGLPNAMLEIRNDLIATPEAEAAMVAQLAPVLAKALQEIEDQGL